MTGFLTAEVTGEDLVRVDPPRAKLEDVQLALSNRLELIRVEHDVADVALRLKRIDPGLELLYDQKASIFILLWKGWRADEKGVFSEHEDLVGAYTELDERIIKLVERIDGQGRGRQDLQRELEKLEAEKDAAMEAAMSEKVGEAAERTRHALRRDLALEGSSVQLSTSRGIEKQRKERRRREKQGRKANR